MKVRFFAMAWNWGIEAFCNSTLPSLMQPDNIPWLVSHGFDVSLNVYTLAKDAAELRTALNNALQNAAPLGDAFAVNVGPIDLDPSDSASLKRIAFLTECRLAVEEGSPIHVTGADCVYGNGSIRNICVYGRKPGIAIAVLYARVKQDPFLRLLSEYRRAFPREPLPNAKLVDMALRTPIDAIAHSYVDVDRNASLRSGTAFRQISDDIHASVYHLPGPVMFWPNESDIAFIDQSCGGVVESIDHLWPAKLVAERRWRIMASTDLFFYVELNDGSTERLHSYPLEDGRLFNEDYELGLPHTLLSQNVVATFRREPYLSRPS